MDQVEESPENPGGALSTPAEPMQDITVEFAGGLESFFGDRRSHAVAVPARAPDGRPVDVAFLVDHLCRHVMTDGRVEMFVADGHVRPGILVLINDADWELEGEEAYQLCPGDSVLFVSTLHGG